MGPLAEPLGRVATCLPEPLRQTQYSYTGLMKEHLGALAIRGATFKPQALATDLQYRNAQNRGSNTLSLLAIHSQQLLTETRIGFGIPLLFS